jgi:hypothetical protein
VVVPCERGGKMIQEARYEFIEGDNKICGGIYYDDNGKIMMQSRYVIRLNWFERLINKLKRKNKDA